MLKHDQATADDIRTLFSGALSEMYRKEVPKYGTLLDIVKDVNAQTLQRDPKLHKRLQQNGELERLNVERHGAIRLGTAKELHTMRRLFAVMDMQPVGYYDLSVAGIPVHSTAFRPTSDEALKRNPFRVFTSLLRLNLIQDEQLRSTAQAILHQRTIFTPKLLDQVNTFESNGYLTREQSIEFVKEALEIFRWQSHATVDAATYHDLHQNHALIADVVCFHGPHINHLTPRTLDIDAVQAEMPQRGVAPKAVIEGPPPRECAILLRQTSFKALAEAVLFPNQDSSLESGIHTARFGEIEQRGAALTRKGRKLYDELLDSARTSIPADGTDEYIQKLSDHFRLFPDTWTELRIQGLAYFKYSASSVSPGTTHPATAVQSVEELMKNGKLIAEPLVYEDFLPVSAAGIFQSNLGTNATNGYGNNSNRSDFERDLGVAVQDEFLLYEKIEQESLNVALAQLRSAA